MRRLSIAASLATVAIGIGLGSSCVRDDGSVFIQGALPIDPGEDCQVAASGNTFIAAGVLDLRNPRSFQSALKVITNLPSTFNNTDVSSGTTQAPNYPDYGATDNNVIIFDSSETTFSFQVAQEIADAADPDVFECDEQGTCATNADKPTISPVAGTVFNKQTQLNTEAVVFVEAINAAFAQTLKDNIGEALKLPGQRVRVVATVRLKGTTTGNGDLRDISTFPFPLPVDVCNGCLTPDNEFCEDNAATFAPVIGAEACFAGQDFVLGQCICDSDGSLLDNAACP